MANFIDAAKVPTLIAVCVVVLGLLLLIGFKWWFRRHPSNTALMKIIKELVDGAVAELDKKDCDGNTKLHNAIAMVLKGLNTLGIKIPDNIEAIITGFIEKAVLDTRYKQATIASNNEQANVLANAPLAQDLTNLPAENGEMITKGNAPSADTDEGNAQENKTNIPVSDDEATEAETAKPVDVPEAESVEPAPVQAVLTINNQKPDENGNINLDIPKVEKDK